MDNRYVLLYGDKKPEDNILIPFMFENYQKIPLGWIDKDKEFIETVIEQKYNEGVNQFIFWGLEVGWDDVINRIKSKYKVKIKVICNTQDSLLYYDYERENFFKLLELSKTSNVDHIAFLRKGMYETYKRLGYSCSYILENICLDKSRIKQSDKKNKKLNIGIYPLNYTWDKNIFNQLSVGKFINNSNINYNLIDERMEDFLKTMKINSTVDKIENMAAYNIANKLVKNDVIVSCSFTDYVHPIFFISMECGVPCILGNTSELCSKQLNEYLIINSEDNPIKIAEKIDIAMKNKDKVNEEYNKWKKDYNKESKQSIEEFINK